MRAINDDEDKAYQHQDPQNARNRPSHVEQPSTHPTPARNCSQGGPWVLEADNEVGNHEDNGEDGSSTWGRRAAPGTTGTTTMPIEKAATGMAKMSRQLR